MLSLLGRLLAKPAVQTGLVLGGLTAARAYQPSLMARSRNDQVLITAGSIAAGYIAGNVIERIVGSAGVATGLDRRYAAAALGACAAAAEQADLPPVLNAAAAVARNGAEVSGSLAVARAKATGPSGGALEAAAIGTTIVSALERQLGAYADDGRTTPPASDVAASFGRGAAVATSAWSLVAVERAIAAAASQAATARLGGPRWMWRAGFHAAVISAGVLACKVAAARFLASLDAAADELEPGYADPPRSPLLSGGPGSVVDHGSLGVSGRRFVAEAVPAPIINEVMGVNSAVDPIRVYVGVDAATTVEDRVALAIAELRRTSAYERGLLIVGSPSGAGYLNYITVEAAEYFTRGDIATVTIQYGKRPSILSLDRLALAQRQHRALVEAIRDDLIQRGPEDRPRLVLYGESLGAQSSQDAFSQPGFDALAEHLVDNALWVGTPYRARFRRAVLSGSPVDASFGQSAAIGDHDPATRYHFLDHHEDPVTLFTPSIFYRRPPWLGAPADRPPNVSKTQRWVPAVTFWQTVFDTKNATEIVPGEFKAFGHDYRADLAEFVRVAYAIDEVSDNQMARVEEALRRSEIERAAKMSSP